MEKKRWSKEELSLLNELYGTKTLPKIAEILNRSIKSVKSKVWELELGSFKNNSEYLSAQDVADILGISVFIVRYTWPEQYGFKFRSIKHSQRSFRYVKHSDLMQWLEHNQDKWDSKIVQEYGLGIEPEWLKEKRRRDKIIPKKKSRFYTPEEDAILISMYRKGYGNQDIADKIGRTIGSIEHRISCLDIWGTGRFIPGRERREIREAKQRKEAYQNLINVLTIRKNQLNFDGYWQKEMCVHWNDLKGCTAEESDCDSCISFQRIQPQYCKRCGNTFFERINNTYCCKCREQRKKQYQRKWMALNGS